MKTLLYIAGDSVKREKEIVRVCNEVFPHGQPERHSFKADQGQIPNAIAELLSYSLFEEEKVVILTGLEKLFARKRKNNNDPDPESGADKIKSLLEIITHPRGDSPLLMFAETLTGIPKSFQNALRKDRIITLQKTSPADIRKGVEKKCAQAGFRMSGQALAFFMETCGHNIDSALQEFQKIELWVDPGHEVSLEECRRLIWGETQEEIWIISNGIRDQNPVKSLLALKKLTAQGEEVYGMLGILINTFRNLYTCKTLLEHNIPQKDWQSYASMSPSALKMNMNTAKSFRLPALRNAISLLSQADSDIKGGKSDPHLVMERAVLDLCRIQSSTL